MVEMCNDCEENQAIADWGVCGKCFGKKSKEIKKDVFSELYEDDET